MSKQDKSVKEAEEAIAKVSLDPANEAEDDNDDEDDEDNDSKEGEELPATVLLRVVALKKLDQENEKILAEYKKERCALEAKYNALKLPLYNKRVGIINGSENVIDENVKPEEAAKLSEEKDIGIPGFWLQTLANHHFTGEYITEEDCDALEALEDITCDYSEDMSEFTLTFKFGENEYFKNKELTKVYVVEPDLLDDQSPTLSTITAPTTMEWKEGKNLTVQEVQKKQRSKAGKKKGQIRYITTTVPKPSFFHFFSEPEDEEENDEEDDDEEEKETIRFDIELDYEIAHTIRTSIIPNAIGWYTGELIEDDYDYDEDDDDEDDDYDDDDDIDEEEIEIVKGTGKGKGKGLKGKKLPGTTDGDKDANPECKQS